MRRWQSAPAVALGLFLVGTALAAQQPARDQPKTPRTGTGVIRGRVVRADTGEPLRRVQVRVEQWSSGDQSGPAATMTDGEGRYELAQLPAGSYILKATRGGYVEVVYGQRRPSERGRPLELAEGAVLQNIDFTLPPGAVVTGRVLDELGEAVPHANVSLLRPRFIEGQRRWVTPNSGSTDDRGEFRIFGVAQGDYVVRASFETMDFGSRDRVRYVPTYYPGTPVASGAQRLTIGLGQEVTGIVIALARATTATVRGTVRLSGGASPGTAAFVTAREVEAAQPEGRSSMGISRNDGTFAITGLLPGTYLLEARSMMESEFGSTELVVGGTDVNGVSLVLSKGTAARGRIRFDTGDPPQGLRPSQVFLFPAFLNDRITHTEMNVERPVVRDDWSFELRGLRGGGFIYAGTLGDWQMKRIRREGTDVTDTPLDFAADIDQLEIELSKRTTTVSGGVSDDHGRVALDATVIVFADDPGKWGRLSRFVQSARPDQKGRFTIKGLPPGKYVAVAVDLLEPGEERDPDLLARWRARGTSFTLSEDENYALDLKLSGS